MADRAACRHDDQPGFLHPAPLRVSRDHPERRGRGTAVAGSTTMISIIVPAYNGARFLDSALSTIRAQEFADIETLLIDDGSEDKLNPPDWVRYFRQEHRGQAAARNHGIRESHGEF